MELNSIVPWGRSFAEYKAMFCLSDDELQSKILGCSDGPASFNAELTEQGGSVTSIDPVYQFSSSQLENRISEVYDEVLSQVRLNQTEFIWDTIPSVEALGETRMAAMRQFLADYEAGKKEQRYIEASLPTLPFNDKQFDIALCSHFLFLYSEHFSMDKHIDAIKELCRVAKEVRIYPLVALDGDMSDHLEPVVSALKAENLNVDLMQSQYAFQKGATQMLVVRQLI